MTETAGTAEITDHPAPPDAPRQRLGTGQIVTTVLAVFFRRLPKIMVLALPAALAVFAVFYGMFIVLDIPDRQGATYVGETLNSPFLPFILGLGLGLGLLSGPMAAALHNYESRGTLAVLGAFRTGATRLHVALVQGLIIVAAVLAPMMALVIVSNARLGLFVGSCALVVGMYALGRWGLGLPCIAMERLGMRGLRRSQALSEDYRWAVAGTCFLLFVAAILFGSLTASGFAIVGALANFLLREFADTPILEEIFNERIDILMMLDLSFGLAIVLTIVALGLAAIRARLVEIKEPLDIETVLHVFD